MKKKLILITVVLCLFALSCLAAVVQSGWTSTGDAATARTALGVFSKVETTNTIQALTVAGPLTNYDSRSLSLNNVNVTNALFLNSPYSYIKETGADGFRKLEIVEQQSGGIHFQGSSALFDTMPVTALSFTGAHIGDGSQLTGIPASGLNGLGANPSEDKIVFFDQSAGVLKYLTIGDNLSISGTELSATSGGTSSSVDTNWLASFIPEFGGDITNILYNWTPGSDYVLYPMSANSTNFSTMGGRWHGPIVNANAQAGFYYPSNEQTGITGTGIGRASLPTIIFGTDAMTNVLRLSGDGTVLSIVVDGVDLAKDTLTEIFNSTGLKRNVQLSTADQYVPIVFASPGRHRVDVRAAGYFKGVYVPKTNAIWRIPTPSRKLLLLGDSFVQAGDGNSVDMMRPLSRVVQDELPDWNVLAYGQSGTGWAANDTGGKTNFYGRLADVIRESPEALVIYGGYNDVSLATDALESNTIFNKATNLLIQVRARFPNMPIFVFAANWPRDITYPATGTDIQVTNLCYLIKTACALVTNVNYFSTIDEPWITGIYSTPNSGNAPEYTSVDGIHPTTAGHRFIGKKIVACVKPVLDGSIISTNAVISVANFGVLSTTTASSVLTNANTFMGYGGIQLPSAWYGQDFPGNDNDNPRNGIEFWEPGWNGVPYPPSNADNVPSAFIHSLKKWGGNFDFFGNPMPATLHMASKGPMRLEPNYGDTNVFGVGYLSLGNEDGNPRIVVNYAHGSVFNHTVTLNGSVRPWKRGYGLPLTFDAIGTANSVEYFSFPAIWSEAGATNATDKSLGTLRFMSKMPTLDGFWPTVAELNPAGVTVATMQTNYFEFALEGVLVTNAGVYTSIRSNNIITGRITVDTVNVVRSAFSTNGFTSTAVDFSKSWESTNITSSDIVKTGVVNKDASGTNMNSKGFFVLNNDTASHYVAFVGAFRFAGTKTNGWLGTIGVLTNGYLGPMTNYIPRDNMATFIVNHSETQGTNVLGGW